MPDGAEENAVKQHPAKAVYDVDGVYVDQINDVLGDAPNMMRLIENNKANKHEYWRVFGNAYLQIEPVKNLIIKTNFGINYYNETNKTFEPKWLRDDVNKLTQSTGKNVDWVWYGRTLHSITLISARIQLWHLPVWSLRDITTKVSSDMAQALKSRIPTIYILAM